MQHPQLGSGMVSFFRKQKDEPTPEPPSPERALVDEVEALQPERRDIAAIELTRLWSWLGEEFGGPTGFLNRSQPEQDAFIDKLMLVVERSRGMKETDLGRYYYSSAMLGFFIKALRSRKGVPDQLALSSLVAAMVERGRHLGDAEGENPSA